MKISSNPNIVIQLCRKKELTQVRALFRNTILNVNIQHYNSDQINIWASAANDEARWQQMLANQHFLIAKIEDKVVGFGTLRMNGYMDTLYVHHEYQRQGIGKALIQALFDFAQSQNIGKIKSDVSITARPLFERMGFVVESEQQKLYRDVIFINYIMYCQLVKPIIVTERLLLRPFIIEDAQDFYDLNADPEVTKYTGDGAFADVKAAENFIRNYHPYTTEGMGRWAVLRKSDGTYIGWCGLRYVPELREVDLGYRFFKKYWGQGYATESSKACLEYGFKALQLNKIVARAMKANIGSIRVMEKLGMRFGKEEVFEKHPGVLYEILKCNF
ncbi:MAG: GNAT family N-acetyltransferase [Saprospiraceae bacterium]|nr:GNAT family N-acetyltransferase [Saprospiraceae bacterium]